MTRSEVYFNLHKKCLSIREMRKGARVKHVNGVLLQNVTFAVQPAGREKVRREKKKTVHAFVRGEENGVYSLDDTSGEDVVEFLSNAETARLVTYNPYKYDSFVYADTEEPIFESKAVVVYGKKIYAISYPEI